jgi:hypothetical protein
MDHENCNSVSVCECALISDLDCAGLDCEMLLFRGWTVVDLAVNTGSLRFMEKCCMGAITKSVYGDMEG